MVKKKKKEEPPDFFQDFWQETPTSILDELWLPEYTNEKFPAGLNPKDIFQVNKREMDHVTPYEDTEVIADAYAKFELKEGVNSATKINFVPDDELKKFLNRCYGVSRTAYNKTVQYISKRNSLKSINEKERTLIRKQLVSKTDYEPSVTLKKLTLKAVTTKKGKQEYSNFIKTFEGMTVPASIICHEVDIAIDTFNRHKKVPKFRSKKRMSRQTITIPYRDIVFTTGVCGVLFNKICSCLTETLKVEVNHDFTISSTKLNRHYVCIPQILPIAPGTDSQGPVKIVAIDPGVRTPFTCYDPSGKCFKIADNKLGLLWKLKLQRNTLQSKRDLYKNFNGKYSDCKTYEEKRVHRKIAFKIRRLTNLGFKVQERISNKRKQFHYDTIKYLLDNYDVVLLSSFDTQGLIRKTRKEAQNKQLTVLSKQEIKKRGRILSNESVSRLLLWAHFQFKTRLLQKAQLRNKRVIIVDEHFTTKTCGNCGMLNDVAAKKNFTCVGCKVNLDRDINAARNILIRYLSKCCIKAPEPPGTAPG